MGVFCKLCLQPISCFAFTLVYIDSLEECVRRLLTWQEGMESSLCEIFRDVAGQPSNSLIIFVGEKNAGQK